MREKNREMQSLQLTPRDMRRIQRAIDYIDQHYQNKMSTEHVAMEVMLNREKLQLGMQYKTGLTLHDYVVKVRIDKAKELLINTDLPMKAIAHSTGFKKPGHFSRVFKFLNNINPTEYRLQFGI